MTIIDFMRRGVGLGEPKRAFSLGLNGDGDVHAFDFADEDEKAAAAEAIKEMVPPEGSPVYRYEKYIDAKAGEAFLKGCPRGFRGLHFWAQERT